ncbi:MAG TPA: DUF4276 family protein [Longimicrobium sp.]|nr:DUF4276 family protein [Longimicrobium sp.]
MRRLHVLAEGQTEEAFVNQVLAPHLAGHGVVTDVRCVTTRRDRHRLDVVHRGGLRDYGKVQRDLQRWMAEDRDAVFTTMLDLYALPKDFPGFADAARLADPYARVRHLEQALAADIGQHRLIPHIQLHEFEALLLSDPAKFDWQYIEHDPAIARLVELANRFPSPELIDDGETTAPSKRIIDEIPEYAYQKATAGPLIARQIGIETMRARCPHFAEWLAALEALDR